MNKTLLFLHFLGLVLGWGPSVAGMAAMRVAAAAPSGEAMGIRRLPPVFARLSAAGLAVLWVTGLIMVWSAYGGPGAMPPTFWVKIAFVLALSALIGMIHMRLARLKRGDMSAAAQLPVLGMAASACAFFAVLFAVIAFE